MYAPSYDDFAMKARRSRMVSLRRSLVADQVTPVTLYSTLKKLGGATFLFESVEQGERWSRYSFIGLRPLASIKSISGKVSLEGEASHLILDLFDPDMGLLENLSRLVKGLEIDEDGDLPPLNSGFVGHIGYDVIREVEDIGGVPYDATNFPDALLHLIGDVVAFDHLLQRLTVISNAAISTNATQDEIDEAYQRCKGRIDEIVEAASTGFLSPLEVDDLSSSGTFDSLSVVPSSEMYKRSVEVAKEHILDGDIFQVVLSKRFSFDLKVEPLTLYRLLRVKNPSPYMYLIESSSITVAGSSPEPLVRVEAGRVTSRPIAGTRRRGKSDAEDQLLASQLMEDPKELAEHTMLVDLARNDLGRISVAGSEVIDELMTLERYSRVMHITSQVSAELDQRFSAVDVLKATMPAGTVSGAPKVRAMQIINDLETVKRGPYAGVIGYLDLSGNMDVAIAIRTVFVEPDGRGHIQAGAGIVFDSIAELEDKECDNKARALLEAIEIANRLTK
ncbi:MAG: chorismate-binding protein [Actinomycetota bacterium]|nr:chorismate-binding protein [Actinomycetota bacterium]